ncbi:MAG: ATP-binding protein, partial [Tepidiformaceae bacterium]
MRIEHVHIDGFGHFSDRDLGPLDAPLTILHGPNEAGKSTLLAFLRTVLFGWPG